MSQSVRDSRITSKGEGSRGTSIRCLPLCFPLLLTDVAYGEPLGAPVPGFVSASKYAWASFLRLA